MAQNLPTFTFNGKTHKLNTATTAATLGKLFKLEEDSINLIDSDGEFIEQENGKFPKLVAGKTYEILGDPEITKIVANKPEFTQGEIQRLNDELAMQTKDMETTLNRLAQVPKAVSMINIFTILAACVHDCSLENKKTAKVIKLLKTPGSFKSSLVQLINETINAFAFADSTTSKIKMKLSVIPDVLLSSIEAASTPEDPGAISILTINEKRIISTANFCADEAKKVADFFEGLIQELVQVATATQGLNEEQVRSIEKAIEEMKIKKEHLIAENKQAQIAIAKQEKRTEEAREQYKKKVAKMGIMGKVFTAMLGDLFNYGLRETVALFKDTSKSSGSRDQTLSNNSTQTCMEKRLLEFLERLLKDGIPDEKLEKEKMKKTCLEQKEFFKAFLNYKPKSEMGKHLHAVAQSYCEQLDSASTPKGYVKLKAQFQLIEIAVQTARKEEDEKLRQESEKFKAAAGNMEQMNNAATTSQSTYQAEQEREDKLNKKLDFGQKALNNLNCSKSIEIMDKQLLGGLEIFLDGGMPEEKLEKGEMEKTCLEQKEFFKAFLDFKAKSEMGKHLHAVAQSYCEQLDSASTPEGYVKLKAQFQVIEIAVHTARKEEDEKLRQESKLFKATAGIIEQLNNAATTVLSTYRADQEREDGLKKEAADFRKEMSDLTAKLGTTDAEKLELQSVIKYLTNKLCDLNNLQVVWLELSKFYQAVANTVSGPLNDTLREFIEYQNSAIETSYSDKIIKRIVVSAMKGCGICFQVIKCSEISQEISANYVLPRISEANANLQLTKGVAEMRLSETETEFIEMENKLKKLIRNRKKDILQSTESKIRDYIKQIAIIKN